MKAIEIIISAACLLLCAASALAQEPANSSGAKLRVGVYDSRAIAVAFGNSEAWQASTGKQLAAMRAEYNAAKAAGNRNELRNWRRRARPNRPSCISRASARRRLTTF